jgi:hypothetical protein
VQGEGALRLRFAGGLDVGLVSGLGTGSSADCIGSEAAVQGPGEDDDDGEGEDWSRERFPRLVVVIVVATRAFPRLLDSAQVAATSVGKSC